MDKLDYNIHNKMKRCNIEIQHFKHLRRKKNSIWLNFSDRNVIGHTALNYKNASLN